jgi:hypothetical protein
MAEYVRRDSGGRALDINAEKSEGEHKSALSKEKFTGFTASKAGASGGVDSGFPKQRAGEDPAAYGARVRAYREKKSAVIK